MNFYLTAIAASLGLVLLIFFLLLSLIRGKSGLRDMPKLYLALLFLEMIILLVPALAQGLGLKLAILFSFLSYADFFYGSPSLFLFASATFGNPVRRPWKLYLPSLVNLFPALVFSFFPPGSTRNVYSDILILFEISLFIYYARRILPLLSASAGNARVSSGRSLCIRLLVCYAGYYLITLAEFIVNIVYRLFSLGSMPFWLQLIPGVFLFASSGFIAFSVIREMLSASIKDSGDEAKPKYGGTALSMERGNAILERVRRFLAQSDDLRDEAAGPRAIATALDIPYYLLSRAANECGGQSVADIVNEARVAKAKLLLIQKPGYDLITIAFDSGFAAKSSFNAVFKRSTGMSPSDFRNARSTEKK